MNDRDEEVAWLITRSGSEPVVENLKGWGKSRDVGDRERMGEEKEGLEERGEFRRKGRWHLLSALLSSGKA